MRHATTTAASLAFVLTCLLDSGSAHAQRTSPPPQQRPTPTAPRPGAAAPRNTAPSQPRVVQLKSNSFAFEVNPATGAVAAVDADGGAVTFYPRLASAGAANPVVARVGPTPAAVVHKRVGEKGYFLVLCAGDHTLHVFNDTTFAPLKKITLKGEQTSVLSAPADPSLPRAFYMGSRGVPVSVNLETFAEEGEVTLGEGYGEFAVSADGRHLYARNPAVSPAGFRCYQLLPPKSPGGPPRASFITNQHQETTTYQPDPFGQYVFTQQQLFTADLKKEAAKVPASTVCFMPDRPVLFGINGSEITAYSYNTFKAIKGVPLPEEMASPAAAAGGYRAQGQRPPAQPSQRGRGPAGAGAVEPAAPAAPAEPQSVALGYFTRKAAPALLADPSSKCVLFCWTDRAAVVPLSAFELPSEPMLFAVVRGKTTLNVGETADVTVAKKDPKVTVELVEGPAGMKLTGDKLVWKPGPGDVGAATASVRLSAGDVERFQTVDFIVRRNAVDLGFFPIDMKVAEDGRTALVMAQGRGEFGPGQPQPQGQQPPACRLALVDLEKGAVVADRTLAVNAVTATIAGPHVFVALQDSDALYVLSRKDLSDVKRLFTAGRAYTLVPVGDRMLFAQTNAGAVLRFSLPDLKAVDPPKPGTDPRYGAGQQVPPPVRVGDGWYYDGTVFDATLTKARLLVQPLVSQYPQPLRVTTANVERFQRYNDAGAGSPVAAFGVTVFQGMIRRPGAQQNVGQIAGVDHAGLVDLPAAVSLVRGGNPNPNEPRDRAQLVLRELVTGTEVDKVVLFDEPPDRVFQYGDGPNPGKVVAAPGVIVATVRDRMFMVPTKDLDPGKFPAPLHFVPQQSTLVIDSAKPTKLTHVVRGGKAPLEFTPGGEMPGLELNPQNGDLTVDPAPFLEKAVEQLVQQATQYRQPDAAGKVPTVTESAEAYRKMIAARFDRLTGRQSAGFPVMVPVSVIARDQEQQTASLDYSVVLEVPRESVMRRVGEIEQQQIAATRPAAAPQRARGGMPRGVAAQAAGAAAEGEVTALRNRVAELEKRNQQLEAQVQLLKDLLSGRADQKNGKPEGKPGQ